MRRKTRPRVSCHHKLRPMSSFHGGVWQKSGANRGRPWRTPNVRPLWRLRNNRGAMATIILGFFNLPLQKRSLLVPFGCDGSWTRPQQPPSCPPTRHRWCTSAASWFARRCEALSEDAALRLLDHRAPDAAQHQSSAPQIRGLSPRSLVVRLCVAPHRTMLRIAGEALRVRDTGVRRGSAFPRRR